MGTHQPDGRKNSEASHRRHPPSFDNFFIMAGAARALNLAYRMAVPIAVGGALASSAIFDVKGGTRAVIFDRVSGVKEGVINEGTHFLIPWLQRSIIFDVRTKPRSISTTTGSKDLQMVSLTSVCCIDQTCKRSPRFTRTSAPITMSVSFRLSATKSSRLLSPSSMLLS